VDCLDFFDMSDLPKKRKLSRRAKILVWTAGLLLAYTVIGFFVVPAVIKSQMLKRLPALTKRQAAIRQVTFNPFTFALALRGLSLTETNGETFAGWDEFHFQFQALSSLSHRAWVFKDVSLTHPFARLLRRKDGTLNVDNLIETNAPPPRGAASAPASALPAVIVERLRVAAASVEVDDLVPAPAFHDKLAPISFEVTNFSTQPNAGAPHVFSAASDAGEIFTASGKITVQPLQFSGHVKVAGLDLKRYAPYLAAFTRAVLLSGKLEAGADYQFAFGAKGPDATMTNGTAQLCDLRVKSPDTGETVVSIPSLAIALAEASLARQSVRVSSVTSSGGSLLVRRSRDGVINLLALLNSPPPAAAPVPAAAAAAQPWTAQVDKIEFTNYAVMVEDQKPPRPVKLEVGSLAFTLEGFNSAGHAPMAAAASMRLNGEGSLSLRGTLALSPTSADLNFDLTNLDLPPFQPYLAGQANLNLAKGRLDVRGQAHCDVTSNGPAGVFTGDVALKDFATTDSEHDRDLVKFDALAITGIQAGFPPPKLQIREVALTGFNATMLLDTNGQLNVLSVLPAKGAAPAPAPAPAPAAAPEIPVDLGALVLEKASFHFIDQSVTPNCDFAVQELGGSIRNLSTHLPAPAAVDMRGSVDQLSPFSIAGTIAPLARDLTLDLTLSFKNFELTVFTPYMEKYGGHPLNKGKLLLDLHYDIAQRKLNATNKVVIADLTLGPKNTSTNAVHLPVKLGVALLKDRQGNITLDIPVAGSLDDPKFRIGPIIWHVVENLLAKAATSPFSLLGSVLGGGGPAPSSADFAPGSATLAPPEKARLQTLAKALYERPALTLQIAGACDPAADGAVLARQHLRRRIAKLRADELAAAGQAVPGVESINLEPADYARLLQKLYERTFGTNLPVSSNTSPAVAAPPRPEPNLAFAPNRGRANEAMRGGALLMRHEAAEPGPTVVVAPSPAPAGPAQPSPTAAAVSAGPAAPDVARMEERLLAEIPVTDDELRALMQARARAVESALTESGQIPPERLFILAPQSVNQTAKGETRAIFSLE
jgi:uncharacterized protein involved in outer membrane biogenesis